MNWDDQVHYFPLRSKAVNHLARRFVVGKNARHEDEDSSRNNRPKLDHAILLLQLSHARVEPPLIALSGAY